MNPLASRYLGLHLAHPIIASVSAPTTTVDAMCRIEDAGAAAVVAASPWDANFRAGDVGCSPFAAESADRHPEPSISTPEFTDHQHVLCAHLELVRRAAEALDIPVIASLSGVGAEGWIDFAVQLELAGAAALELALQPVNTRFAAAGIDLERRHADMVRQIKCAVRIPVSVKLPPLFGSLGHFSRQLETAGADGLVFSNRLLPPDLEIDIDIDTRTVTAEPVLATRGENQIPLSWLALLSPHLKLSLAASGNVESHVEVVKFLLAGAHVVAATPTLLRHGPQHMTALVEGLRRWLADHEIESVAELRGHLNGTHVKFIDALLHSQYAYSRSRHGLS